MSNRDAHSVLASDAFFFKLGSGQSAPGSAQSSAPGSAWTTLDWMAGGAVGDVVEELRKEGHISDRQYVAVCRLLEDMRRAHGTSAGIVPEYGERVQTSVRPRGRPPGGGDPDAFNRMDRLLGSLREHERRMLGYLIVKKELPRGSLADYGRQASGYKHNRAARAFATGKIRSLLESIEELYCSGS